MDNRKLNARCARPAKCHPEKAAWGRGLCKNCYDKWLKRANPAYAMRQQVNCRAWLKTHAAQQRENGKKWLAKQDRHYRSAVALTKYGLTWPDYVRMLRDQGGGCAICGRLPSERRRLAVDHDHKTGKVRGLLCFRCNWGLSYFSESARILERAAAYLDRRNPSH